MKRRRPREVKKNNLMVKKRSWLQAGTCARTRVVSGVPQPEFKVQVGSGSEWSAVFQEVKVQADRVALGSE